jgi:Ser/Thr protein kinase RdoA (MazF antagonist)
MMTPDDWFTLAPQALAAYHMPDATYEWLAYTHNAVFNVLHQQQSYILRLSRQPHQKDRWRLMGELYVLYGLRNEGGLCVPESVDAPAKQMYVFLPETNVCAVLFRHLPGTTPSQADLTQKHMQRIGAFLAQLHSIPAAHWQNIRNNRNLSLRPNLDYDGLFSNEGMYALADESVFTEEQQAVITEVQEHVKTAMDVIGTDEAHFGLIHGDLLLKNILFEGEKICALDFEYSGFGYFIYDLAPLLWQLKLDPRYPDLVDGLWEGYSARRSLPPYEHLETFIAARQVASLRWLVNNQHNPAVQGKAPHMIQQRVQELREFLITGILQRQ